MTVLVHDSDKTLAEVADIAASGEEVLLVRDGKTVARVTRDESHTLSSNFGTKRRFGFMKGLGFTSPTDIKTPFKDEVEKMFYGDERE